MLDHLHEYLRGTRTLGLSFCVGLIGFGMVAPSAYAQQRIITDDRAYFLELSADGLVVRLSGTIDFGLTHDLAEILERDATIRMIHLESGGGRVAEGRGVAMLITRYGLATHTGNSCLSACTLAYMSGVKRSLGPDARLGFHSYRLNSPLVALFMDPAEEMRKDLARFEGRNIEPAFLARIADTPHTEMWFPSHDELLTANVVHEITP